MVQRVSLIDSNSAQLNHDYDFTKLVKWFLNDTDGVLFSNLSTKPEFDLNLGTGELETGTAIILCTRTASSPITNQSFLVLFQSSEVETVDVSVGQKIFIEITNTLLQDPTLIQDTPPATDYAQGLNIGTIKSETSYPAHGNYIKLWEISSGPTKNDMRETPSINGLLLLLTSLTQDITTTGTITANLFSGSGASLTGVQAENRSTFTYGETITVPSGEYLLAYYEPASGKIYLNDTSSELTNQFGVLVAESGNADTAHLCYKQIATLAYSGVAGDIYYANSSGNNGEFSTSKPSSVTAIPVGIQITSALAIFLPNVFNVNATQEQVLSGAQDMVWTRPYLLNKLFMRESVGGDTNVLGTANTEQALLVSGATSEGLKKQFTIGSNFIDGEVRLTFEQKGSANNQSAVRIEVNDVPVTTIAGPSGGSQTTYATYSYDFDVSADDVIKVYLDVAAYGGSGQYIYIKNCVLSYDLQEPHQVLQTAVVDTD